MALSPTQTKVFDTYYETLLNLQAQDATHEQATRLAFSTLIDTMGRGAGWTLVLEDRLANKKRPDGTLKDNLKLPRGYWEAKDLDDDLDAEIRAKSKLKYPLINTIFENTRDAVLFQNGREAGRFNITQPEQLASLFQKFFAHTEEDIDAFHEAAAEFQMRLPDHALALQALIHEQYEVNAAFTQAFDGFHALCKSALNPSISRAAIEEMLVQHLLSERLFRTVFDNPEFTQRNVIASEIESVIAALTSLSFSRQQFLRGLNSFYTAIENQARSMTDWSEKQEFLNVIYEKFFQDYSTKQADTMGIVYTPQPIVDWMCASVEQLLETEFETSLSNRGVQILDPCVGTGNFIVNVLKRISGANLKHKFQHDIWCNEVMLLPYYIASLNIEHQHFTRTKTYAPFEGICFADTLDLNEVNLFSEENTERIKREKAAKMMVIIGNPPYNVGQKNENDNNKNRKYPAMDKRIKETYARASSATNKNALSDPYVKFFRWATDRLNGNDGIVCFVSNNSFLDQNAFDGMRKHLSDDFDQIYHLDLHGNVRKNPKLSGTTHNVMGIQVGVGITICVKRKGLEKAIRYHRVPEDWKRVEKLQWLANIKDVRGIEWQTLAPDAKNNWLTAGLQADFDALLPMGTKEAKAHWGIAPKAIFKNYGRGVATCRDDWVYDWNRDKLAADVKRFIETYNGEVERWQQRDKTKTEGVDEFVSYDDSKIKWSETLKQHVARGTQLKFIPKQVRNSLYRPFCKQFLYFDHTLNERVYQLPKFFPTPESEQENQVICVNAAGNNSPFHCLMTNVIPDLHLTGDSQCFPFYTYAEDGSNRTENITDWALEEFRAQCGAGVSKRDIFHYVYALLHQPQYRARYGENLKKSLPRLPILPASFARFAQIGSELARLHLNYETAPEYGLKWVENREEPFSWRVEKMKLISDKSAVMVNRALTLQGIPPQALEYRLGNRSALEWIVDQYQVKTDARSGLSSDPNRDDDEEYIARLIGRVVTVSVETMRLVAELGV